MIVRKINHLITQIIRSPRFHILRPAVMSAAFSDELFSNNFYYWLTTVIYRKLWLFIGANHAILSVLN